MTTTKLKRVELAFHDDNVIGGQVSFVDTVDVDGKPYALPERVTGLDCGGNPEYATTVEEALGEALSEAVAANAGMGEQLTAANVEVERLEGELSAANAEIARLGAALDAATAPAPALDIAPADESA